MESKFIPLRNKFQDLTSPWDALARLRGIADLKGEVSILITDYHTLKDGSERAQGEVDARDDSIKELNEKLGNAETGLLTSQDRESNLEAENSSLKAASTLAREEIDARDATIKTLNEQLKAKGDKLVAVQKSKKNLTVGNKKLKEVSEHAKNQMATQANTISFLQAQLEQMRIATAGLPKNAGVQTSMPGLIGFGKLSVQQARVEPGLEVAKELTFHK